jgi:hypothetical protein
MGEERRVYNVLVGKPEGKRPLGRPRHKYEDGIRVDLTYWLGGGGFRWLDLGTRDGLL